MTRVHPGKERVPGQNALKRSQRPRPSPGPARCVKPTITDYRGISTAIKEALLTYALLLGAIFAEVLSTSLLKSTQSFTRLWPSVISLAGYGTSFVLLAAAIARGLQTDVAYALWSAIGTVAIVVIAVVFLGSPISVAKVAGIALIIAGVVTLNLFGAS